MSYLAGSIVPLEFTLTLNDVDTDATTVTATVVRPDGQTDDVTLTHEGTGRYGVDYDTTGKAAGRYAWVATASGLVQAVASGVFDVVDPLHPDGSALWTDAAAIARMPNCAAIDPVILDDAARAASEILWALSGRQFAGSRESYVRPTARRAGAWWAAGLPASWGSCGYAYGYGGIGVGVWRDHSCSASPTEVELGPTPVTAIVEVKIDGEVIPDDEYQLYERRSLVRTLPTATAQPTVRGGWPTCQRLDLPDSEDGTFSIRFRHGAPPPQSGVLAANVLGAEFAIARGVDDESVESRLPARVTSIVRQGESITVLDPQDVLDKGRTGIPEVDLFLKAMNPAGLARRASVWSPDLGRARRPS